MVRRNFQEGAKSIENPKVVDMDRTKIVVMQPVYLEKALLDLSKLVMYGFHYGKKLQLCYMNTDNICITIALTCQDAKLIRMHH